jgi:hypothetical protein
VNSDKQDRPGHLARIAYVIHQNTVYLPECLSTCDLYCCTLSTRHMYLPNACAVHVVPKSNCDTAVIYDERVDRLLITDVNNVIIVRGTGL